MQCPVCIDEILIMTDRAGIEIDYCPRCRGIWLDRGELDKLIDSASALPPYPTPTSEADYPRKRKNDEAYHSKNPLEQHTHPAERNRSRSRRRSAAYRVKDFLEEIFDILD